MEQSYAEKAEKFQELIRYLEQNGVKATINGLCCGSLGSVDKNVRAFMFEKIGTVR